MAAALCVSPYGNNGICIREQWDLYTGTMGSVTRASSCGNFVGVALRALGQVGELAMRAPEKATLAMIFLLWTSALLAQEVRTPPYPPRVAAITQVDARDAQGRPELVRNANGIQFRAQYREDGHLESLRAVRGIHMSDIRLVGYLPDGRIAGVLFENGYSISYQYLADGRQVVSDGVGGLVSRLGVYSSGQELLQSSDPQGMLVSSLALIDGLNELVRDKSVLSQ
jgi:hypothetical protein